MDYQLGKKQYDFLAKDFKKPKSFIYRVSVNGRRYYYELEHGHPIIYASGTTLINDGYPDPSNAMEHWRLKMRMEGRDPDAYANYRATYGTVMHILFGMFLEGKKIPLHTLGKFIENLKDTKISQERIKELVDNNLEEFKRDLLAFAQFVKDHNVKPLAIELMIRSKKHMVATAIDLVCEMDIEVKGFFGEVYKSGVRKGEPKETKRIERITALVDFKSGKKGFYDKHALQLLLNKQMVNENYPNLKIGAIYNFSPKEWKTTPSYNLKDQSNNPVLNELTEILSIGTKRHLKKNKTVKIYNGNLSIGEDFDFQKNYSIMPLDDYILTRKDSSVDIFSKLLEDEKLDSASSLRIFLNKQKVPFLKDLAKGVGIQYTKKQEFIKKLNQKFIDGKGKDSL